MDRNLSRRFASFYFLFYLPIGMQAPYLFLYFKRVGFTDSQLGTLAAVTPVLNIFAPPLWGALADMLGDRRRTLTALLICAGLLFPCLAWASSFAVTLALMLAFSGFSFAPGAIADAIALENVERHRGDYGRLRLWGSLGFAVPLLAFGAILKGDASASAASLYPMFVGYAVFRLLSAGWVGFLPPSHAKPQGFADQRVGQELASRPGGEEEPQTRFLPAHLGAAHCFANRRFLSLAACALVGMAAMSAYYLYFTIYLDEVRIADNLKGYFWAISVAAETAMMLLVGRLIRRIGLKWTFVLSLFGCFLRLFAFSFALQPLGIALTQLLHSLTFTAFMVSTITFVSRLTPPERRASGQALWMSLTSGLGSAAGSKLSGMVAGAVGLMQMFRFFAFAAAAAMIAAIALVREPSPDPDPRG